MISFDHAFDLVCQAARPIGSETVTLEEAAGRVLADPVHALIDAPRTDVSAMDGYAVREADLRECPVRLEVIDESFPGSTDLRKLSSGCAARIFTGAPLPPASDRVVMQENVRREGGTAVIEKHPGPATHVRDRGSDFRVGDRLLEAGRLLDPRALVAAAGADIGRLEVHARPRIVILNTGDELAAPGTARGTDGTIPESVSFGVTAMAEQWGGAIVRRSRLRDELGPMKKAAAAALRDADLVVVTGGASVGERDFAKTMFEDERLELIFSKVAIKPGKPVWLGRAGGRLVMGLPGNPTSALVTGRLLLTPLVAGLAGRDPEVALGWREATLAAPVDACGDRETFLRARREAESVRPLANKDSSAQRTLAAADMLIRRPAGSPAAKAGEPVNVVDF